MKRKERGEGYIDSVIFFLIVVIGLALIVNVLPVFGVKQDLDQFAKAVMREVEIAGDADTGNAAVAAVIKSLRDNTGLDPEIAIEAAYYVEGTKIQMDTVFNVTCTSSVTVGGFGGFSGFEIPLTAVASGRSEQYWK